MRRLLSVIVLVSVIGGVLGVFRVRAAAQSGAIHLSVEAGFQNRFRENRWTPLLISVSNDGPDVSGELRVVSGNTLGLTAGGYATPVDLPTQSSKQLFLYVAFEVYTQQVQVELATLGGTVLQSVTAPMTRIDKTAMQYAVITESPTGSIDLTTARGSGDAYQSDWRIENLPPLASALNTLDALLLTDVDTGKFTTEQRRAIAEWVLSGGHLIVTGGPNWQKTRSGVDNLIPFTANGTVTLNSVNAFIDYAGIPSDQLTAGSVIVAQGLPTADAKVLVQQDNVPLLVRGRYGQGTVDYLTADPGLEPFRSWTHRAAVWQNVLGSAARSPGWSQEVVNVGEAAQAANFVKGLRLPDIFQLAAFLGVYILLIGPVNYVVLRAIRRLEWAWFSIPIIILLTSIAAYVTGFSLRGTQATINRMSLVQVWPGSDQARVDGVVGVLAPRRAIYSVAAAQGLTLRTLSSDPFNTDALSSIKVNEGLTYGSDSVPVDAGLSAAFATSGYIPAPAIDSSATVQILDDGRLAVKGRVQNTTNLAFTDALVLVMGTTFPIGALNPGEERAFEFPVKPLDNASPAFNDVNSPVYGRSYTASSNNNERNKTLRELLNSGYVAAPTRGGVTQNDSQEVNRRAKFLAGMTTDGDLGTGRGVDVYLAAWNASSPVGISLRDSPFVSEDTTLYLFKLKSVVSAVQNGGNGNIVRLTPGYMIWSPLGTTGQRAYTPYNLYLSNNEQAAFQYNPIAEAQLANVSALILETRRSSISTNAVMSVWDWKAAQWVDLPEQDNSTRTTYTINDVNDLARFIGPQNAVRVQVQPSNSTANLDRVDVILEGRLQG